MLNSKIKKLDLAAYQASTMTKMSRSFFSQFKLKITQSWPLIFNLSS